MVKEFVAIYNHERSHLALKYKTPDEVHQPFYGQKTVNLYQEQLKPGAYLRIFMKGDHSITSIEIG